MYKFLTAANPLHSPNVLSIWSGGENTNTKTPRNTITDTDTSVGLFYVRNKTNNFMTCYSWITHIQCSFTF